MRAVGPSHADPKARGDLENSLCRAAGSSCAEHCPAVPGSYPAVRGSCCPAVVSRGCAAGPGGCHPAEVGTEHPAAVCLSQPRSSLPQATPSCAGSTQPCFNRISPAARELPGALFIQSPLIRR